MSRRHPSRRTRSRRSAAESRCLTDVAPSWRRRPPGGSTNPPAVAASTANATNPAWTRRTRSRCERRRCQPLEQVVAVHRALGPAEPAGQLVIDLRHRSSPRRRASPGRPPDAPAPARASSSRCLRRSRGPRRPRRCSSPAGTGGRPPLAAGGGASTSALATSTCSSLGGASTDDRGRASDAGLAAPPSRAATRSASG